MSMGSPHLHNAQLRHCPRHKDVNLGSGNQSLRSLSPHENLTELTRRPGTPKTGSKIHALKTALGKTKYHGNCREAAYENRAPVSYFCVERFARPGQTRFTHMQTWWSWSCVTPNITLLPPSSLKSAKSSRFTCTNAHQSYFHFLPDNGPLHDSAGRAARSRPARVLHSVVTLRTDLALRRKSIHLLRVSLSGGYDLGASGCEAHIHMNTANCG